VAKNITEQAKTAFQNMRIILCSRSSSIEVRKNVLRFKIEPKLLYDSQAWRFNTNSRKHLEATEMWFYRRMMKIALTYFFKVVKLFCLKSNKKRKILNCIWRRQSHFIGHDMRICGLENIVTTGKFEGRRDRDRKHEKMLGSLIA
jgi:hypothetical protein